MAAALGEELAHLIGQAVRFSAQGFAVPVLTWQMCWAMGWLT